MGSSLDEKPPVGKHQLAFTFRIEIFNGPFDSGAAKPLYKVDRTLAASVEIVPKDPGLPLEHDESNCSVCVAAKRAGR